MTWLTWWIFWSWAGVLWFVLMQIRWFCTNSLFCSRLFIMPAARVVVCICMWWGMWVGTSEFAARGHEKFLLLTDSHIPSSPHKCRARSEVKCWAAERAACRALCIVDSASLMPLGGTHVEALRPVFFVSVTQWMHDTFSFLFVFFPLLCSGRRCSFLRDSVLN